MDYKVKEKLSLKNFIGMDVAFGSLNKNTHRRNEITFNLNSDKIYDKERKEYKLPFYENEIVRVITDDGKERKAVISYKKYTHEKEFWMSKRLKNEIGDLLSNASLEREPQINFKDYKVASAENVKDGRVKIVYHKSIMGEKDRKVIEDWGEGLIGIRIVNNLNGSSIYIEKESILLEENNLAKENYVSLTYEHRMMLDIEFPTYINEYYLNLINTSCVDESQQEFQTYYKDEKNNVCLLETESEFEAKGKVRRAFRKAISANPNFSLLTAYPIYQGEKEKITILSKIKNFFLNIFIGNKKKIKKVIRPYAIDEGDRVVRLTENSIKQLGIDENDFIILSNRKNFRTTKAKVLQVDDEHAILKENRIKDTQYLNLCIGIPLHLREELDLHGIETTITIERDLGYLFRKHLNSQVQSILGLVLSSIALKDYIENELVLILVSIFIAVILAYLSFSEVRGRVDNGKKRFFNYRRKV